MYTDQHPTTNSAVSPKPNETNHNPETQKLESNIMTSERERKELRNMLAQAVSNPQALPQIETQWQIIYTMLGVPPVKACKQVEGMLNLCGDNYKDLCLLTLEQAFKEMAAGVQGSFGDTLARLPEVAKPAWKMRVQDLFDQMKPHLEQVQGACVELGAYGDGCMASKLTEIAGTNVTTISLSDRPLCPFPPEVVSVKRASLINEQLGLTPSEFACGVAIDIFDRHHQQTTLLHLKQLFEAVADQLIVVMPTVRDTPHASGIPGDESPTVTDNQVMFMAQYLLERILRGFDEPLPILYHSAKHWAQTFNEHGWQKIQMEQVPDMTFGLPARTMFVLSKGK